MLVCMVASLKQQLAGCMANRKDRLQTEAINLKHYDYCHHRYTLRWQICGRTLWYLIPTAAGNLYLDDLLLASFDSYYKIHQQPTILGA